MKTIGTPSLRPYQAEAQRAIVEAWKSGQRAVMMQMATGAGKTRLFVDLVCRMPTARVLIVTHREELVEQISETLTGHYHLEHGVLQGRNTKRLDRRIVVASIQSWTRNRLTLPEFTHIIVDEAHHSLAESYRELWRAWPGARILGVTATPYRLKRAAFTELYDTLLESWPMRRMIDEGYLAEYRLLTVSEQRAALRRINRLTKFGADGDYKTKDLQEIMAQDEEVDFLYECYRQAAQGRKGIVYAVNREHARKIAERFATEGVAAVAIDSRTKAKERKQRIEEFKDGRLQILVNVELFTEGFDCPSIEFVMLARPTRSLTMYMQQVGRAVRIVPAAKEIVPAAKQEIVPAAKQEIVPAAKPQDTQRGGLEKAEAGAGAGAKAKARAGAGVGAKAEAGAKAGAGAGAVVVLDCVGLRHRFGMPDRRREWQGHFRGERPTAEMYERRSLGEPEHFPMLREVTAEARYRQKPAREILPSEGAVHVFRDNEHGLYGTCDEDGTTIERPLYNEIRQTPFGWFQGFVKTDGCYYPVVFNRRGEECLMCTSLRRVDHYVYEALWNNRAIRFNLHLRIIPQSQVESDGTTTYQISHNAAALYCHSLELGSPMFV